MELAPTPQDKLVRIECIEIPDLEEILDNAPQAIYKPHNNGFYLENDVVRMQYTQIFFGAANFSQNQGRRELYRHE